MLSEGDKAPDFSLPDQNGDEVKLSELRGGTVVLYFYPRADTGKEKSMPSWTRRWAAPKEDFPAWSQRAA